MKIIEKFIQMPFKVKLSLLFLVSLSLLVIYIMPWIVISIFLGIGVFYAIVTILDYLTGK